jgi:hypothetical protein
MSYVVICLGVGTYIVCVLGSKYAGEVFEHEIFRKSLNMTYLLISLFFFKLGQMISEIV